MRTISRGSSIAALAAAGLCTHTAPAQDGLPFQIPAPIDSKSFGVAMVSGGDVDGDGRHDIVVLDWDWEDAQGNAVGKCFCYPGFEGEALWSDVGLDPRATSLFAAFVNNTNRGESHDVALSIGTNADDGNTIAGEVRLYDGKTGDVIWTVPGDIDTFRIGNAIAAVGDLTGDGIDEIAVNSIPLGVDSSSVRILDGSDGSVYREIPDVLTPYRLANAGDIDNDLVPDLLVGSWNTDDTKPERVTIYSGATGEEIRSLEDPDGESGFAFAISGGRDVNGDDVPDVLVGRPQSFDGAAFLFSGADGSLLRRFVAPANSTDLFGAWCALVDVYGSDRVEVIVADTLRKYAYNHESPRPFRYWYTGMVLTGTISGLEHATGDINNDGYDDVLGAAYAIDPGSVNVLAGSPLALSFHPRFESRPPVINPPSERRLVVAGAKPNGLLRIFASLSGTDCKFIPKLGICLYLSPPLIFLGELEADRQGNAAFTLSIPLIAPRGPLYLQALEASHPGVGPITSDVLFMQIDN